MQDGGQTHVRLPVRVGDGAKATIVERQTGSGAALVSSVSHLLLGEGAEIVWLIVQDQPESATHLGQFNAELGKNAKLTLFVMNAGGKLVRQEIRVAATGEGGDLHAARHQPAVRRHAYRRDDGARPHRAAHDVDRSRSATS